MRSPQKTEPASLTASMGKPIQVYRSDRKQLAHWGPVFLAVLFILGAFLTLAAGGYLTYVHYYRNGPAVVGKDLILPAAGAAVLLLLGLWASAKAYRLRNVSVSTYETGFVYQNHRGKQTWLWNEVSGVRVGIFAPFTRGLNIQKKYLVALRKSTGEQLLLTDSLGRMEDLIGELRRRTLPNLCAEAFSEIGDGKICRYGPVEVNAKDGVRVGKTAYPWEKIQSLDVSDGSLVFRIDNTGNKNNHQIKIQVQEIENLEVLLTVVEHYRAAAAG